MTLYQIVSILKQIALTQPNVKSATDGSVYEVMNTNPSVKYNVVHLSQTKHISDEETDTYGFNIFYISRLEDSLEDNRLQIQSIGKEILDNILRTFCENWNIDFPDIIYYPFTQKFTDLCAGCYCKVEIEVPKEIICADDFIGEVIPSDKNIRLQDVSVTITENGLRVIEPSAGYDGIGQITINTEVPQVAGRLEYKEVEYTGNGEYSVRPSSGYDALSEVAISVNVPATPDRYDEGFADGEQSQKDKMVTTAVTQNGLYIREDGYSAFYVEVDNSHNEDLIANLQGDYYVIPDGTDHLRQWAFYNTCFSSITIPTTVSAIGKYAFAYNNCLTSITIPDSVQFLGTYAFAYCDVLETAIIGSGISEIQDRTFTGCRALTGITIPSGVTSIGNGVFDGCSALTEMTFEGLTPPTLGNTGNSLGSTAYTFTIYVPCSVVDDYKEAFGTAYAPRITCIEPPVPTGDTAATAITLNVASAITGSGKATVTVRPSSATTNLVFSSSNSSIATIDQNGNIVAVSNGQVQFCVVDTYTNLSDCKTVNIIKNSNVCYITATYDVQTTSSATKILYNTSSFSKAELADGTVIPLATTYKFSSTGPQTIRYTLTGSVIGYEAFLNVVYLVGITIPSCVTRLEGGAFAKTSIRNVTIPNSVTEIGDSCFRHCWLLTRATIGNSVVTIGTMAFTECSRLTAVTFGNSVKNIYSAAFEGAHLKSVVLPSSVTYIGSSAFTYNMSSMTLQGTTPPRLGDTRPLGSYDYTYPIYVPASSVNTYKTTTGWTAFASRITAIS